MNSEPVSFVAASAEEVVAQIRSSLGPDAVVLNVRPIKPPGLARLWRKPMIEVLARRAEPTAATIELAPSPVNNEMDDLRRRMNRLEQQLERQFESRAPVVVEEAQSLNGRADSGCIGDEGNDEGISGDGSQITPDGACASQKPQWRVASVLERTGMLPVHADYVVEQLRARCGEKPPPSLTQELGLARGLLTQLWTQSPPFGDHGLHVLIGPPGSGKTTFLCKWLAQLSLVEGKMARVWRLDGAKANLAQNLTVYCEVLAVPMNRFWQGETRHGEPPASPIAEDIGMVDLPGADWRDEVAMSQLAQQIKGFGECHVHLVVNGAYDTAILLSQIRAFSALPIADLIVTHLDEEPQWGKLWNLVLGTNYTIRYLSTGQNVPGDFCAANAEGILAEQFR